MINYYGSHRKYLKKFSLGFKKEEKGNRKQKYSRRREGAFERSIRNESSMISKSEIQLHRISHHNYFKLMSSKPLVPLVNYQTHSLVYHGNR